MRYFSIQREIADSINRWKDYEHYSKFGSLCCIWLYIETLRYFVSVCILRHSKYGFHSDSNMTLLDSWWDHKFEWRRKFTKKLPKYEITLNIMFSARKTCLTYCVLKYKFTTLFHMYICVWKARRTRVTQEVMSMSQARADYL